jgi:HPt (histidine-containing phosphotransfer) domain-containing protein
MKNAAIPVARHGRAIVAQMRPVRGARGHIAHSVTALLTSRAVNGAKGARIYPDFALAAPMCAAMSGENGMARPAALTNETALAAAIDRGHLTRMTFGDRSLEREVLELFDRQAAMLIGRMRAGNPAAVASLAHTLKGSAAGIGAGRVVIDAQATETAATHSASECSLAIDRLAKAVDEARALIAQLLRES